MIEIIAVSKRKPDQNDTDQVFYIEDRPEFEGIADKYNWAIENIALKSDDDVICFRHDDTSFRTPEDMIVGQVRRAFEKGAGVCGVIGTIMLENSCTWWRPNRYINGSGYIIQGGLEPLKDKDGKDVIIDGEKAMKKIEYPMADHRGTHDYLATVDGCCMWINKKLFEEGVRFDRSLKGYHFYDVDICLQALSRGYKVSTVNIVVKHESIGEMSNNSDELRKVVFEKWNKRVDSWPISRLSKFH